MGVNITEVIAGMHGDNPDLNTPEEVEAFINETGANPAEVGEFDKEVEKEARENNSSDVLHLDGNIIERWESLAHDAPKMTEEEIEESAKRFENLDMKEIIEGLSEFDIKGADYNAPEINHNDIECKSCPNEREQSGRDGITW